MSNPSVSSAKRQSRPGFIQMMIGVGLLLVLVASWFYHARYLHRISYQIFDFSKTISWLEIDKGILRQEAQRDLDNTLYSKDVWDEFSLNFDLIRPRDCGVTFRFKDDQNLDFLFFNSSVGEILWGRRINGQSQILQGMKQNFGVGQSIVLQVAGDKAELFIDGLLVAHQKVPDRIGKIGLVIRDADTPKTFFHGLTIKGTLANGEPRYGQSPAVFSARSMNHLPTLLLPYAAIWMLTVFLARGSWLKPARNLIIVNGLTSAIVHLILTVFFFWPFVTQGWILMASYDNLGEIYPLYIFSKHNFDQIIHGHGQMLWNSYSHNGVPFYNSHWNMIYYPLNWPVFLAPEKFILRLMTLRMFVETFFIGILAYGFFKRELRDRGWALFCSIGYQMGSFLIFSITIFPTVALFFAMTWFLYLVWSMEERCSAVNFILLTLAVVFILTSANVAFIFYAVLALIPICCYRFMTREEGIRGWGIVVLSVAIGFLICSIRVLCCLWGVLASNRLVDNYYTLHDRFFMVVRLFLPEVTGWLGTQTFNVLKSDKLNLIFQYINLPTNVQNAFFVYFGIATAVLLTAAFVTLADGRVRFWKWYALVTLAVALLWQPVWGIISILFFPLNHYSYHTIVLPVGICALAGHTAVALTQRRLVIRDMIGRLMVVWFFVFGYAWVILTYLYPPLTPWTRSLFILGFIGFATDRILSSRRPSRAIIFRQWLTGILLIGMVGVMLFLFTLLILAPLPQKADELQWAIFPLWSAVLCLTLALAFQFLRESWQACSKWKQVIVLVAAITIPLLLTVLFSLCLMDKLLHLEAMYRVYICDVILGYWRWLIFLPAAVMSLWLWQKEKMAIGSLTAVWIILAFADLVTFNLRFNSITAPFYYNRAFYEKDFMYKDIHDDTRAAMDLINYRVSDLDKAEIVANENLIFGIPSYSGIVGYMPQRFSRFITQFGYPKGTIMIYSGDSTSNPRFLDLSAVRYVVETLPSVQERPSALARLNLFSNYRVIEDDEETLAKLSADDFAPKETLLLSEPPVPNVVPIAGPSTTLLITDHTTDMIKAEYSASALSLVLFAESYDEGWKAFVDNRPVPVIRANYNFMAAAVEAGRHTIWFKYQPEKYFLARRLSVIGLVIFAIILIGIWRWPVVS